MRLSADGSSLPHPFCFPTQSGTRYPAREKSMNGVQTAEKLRPKLDPFYRAVESVLIGQRHLIDGLLVGLLSDGHILLEGVPGLAKTLAVRTVARALHLKFQRIQFTPDL